MLPRRLPPLLTASSQRPSLLLLCTSSTTSTTITPSYNQNARAISTSRVLRDGGHGSDYDPPGGWLWGIRPGEKYEKEGWENTLFYGFYGSIAVAMVAYAFKPDDTIQTWALEEARRRLEKEGILEDPDN